MGPGTKLVDISNSAGILCPTISEDVPHQRFTAIGHIDEYFLRVRQSP